MSHPPSPLGCHRVQVELLHELQIPISYLFFTYGSVYVSTLLSQYIPPSGKENINNNQPVVILITSKLEYFPYEDDNVYQ